MIQLNQNIFAKNHDLRVFYFFIIAIFERCVICMGGGVRGIESGVEVRSSEACSGEAGVRPWTLRSMAALRKRSRSSCITSTSPLYMKSKSRVSCLGGSNLR